MEKVYQFCRDIALHFARKLLPERDWEDCAGDFLLHLRAKAKSDEQLALWLRKTPEHITHCAHYFMLDCARKLGRHQDISTSHRAGNEGGTLEWDIAGCRDVPGEGLDLPAFWRLISSISRRLTERSLEILLRCYRDGQSHREIAAEFGMKVNAVSSTISRAVRMIAAECAFQGITRDKLTNFLSILPEAGIYRLVRLRKDDDV